MGKLKEMLIEQQTDQDLLICELQQTVEKQKEAIDALHRMLVDTTDLFRGAIRYSRNPYQDNETEFDTWLEAVCEHNRRFSPKE